MRAHDPEGDGGGARASSATGIVLRRATPTSAGGRRRAGHRHRVERVPQPRLRPDAAACSSGRSSSTGATCTTRPDGAARLRVSRHRPAHAMRVLITGAAGFLGSHLTRPLPRRGHRSSGMDNFITGHPRQHRAPRRRPALPVRSSTTSRTFIVRRGPARRRAALRLAREPDRLPRAADPDPQGGLARHPQGARRWPRRRAPASSSPRPPRSTAIPLVHPAAGELLGQRQPGRPARRVRRGQALRRGDDHGLPPLPRRGHPHRADLQHLRPADAARRRPGGVELHRAGAAGASRSRSTATAARRARSATWTT